ncbi:MAG: A/G-specific adenine glycosylase [Desulfovibrio sp.]|jgi:A/G-specific adenine glycosylase|nr:A/G-specific adenine glycosylase [Desulfovibrio sp.]
MATGTRQATLPFISPPRHLPPEGHVPELQRALLSWFAEHMRPLPWRRRYAPYEVWISEMMLQQTQMERGVAYFERWMERFPDLSVLAAAEEDEVLKMWEGLGYYNRARNVLAAARLVVSRHGGVFPSGIEDIRALPGIGPYTAAAIASIAFGAPVPCIDANVERVLSRIFDIDTPLRQSPGAERVKELASAVLPKDRAREHNQAMMELGALVCRKSPQCSGCPVADFCVARHLGVAADRPVALPKTPRTPIVIATGVLRQGDAVYVQRREEGDVWGGLWEFPGGVLEPGETPEDGLVREYREETGFTVSITRKGGVIVHAYTTYRVTMHWFVVHLPVQGTPPPPSLTAASEWRWATLEELQSLPLPSPHRKLADSLFGVSGAGS